MSTRCITSVWAETEQSRANWARRNVVMGDADAAVVAAQFHQMWGPVPRCPARERGGTKGISSISGQNPRAADPVGASVSAGGRVCRLGRLWNNRTVLALPVSIGKIRCQNQMELVEPAGQAGVIAGAVLETTWYYYCQVRLLRSLHVGNDHHRSPCPTDHSAQARPASAHRLACDPHRI